jgi:hypothetical protein
LTITDNNPNRVKFTISLSGKRRVSKYDDATTNCGSPLLVVSQRSFAIQSSRPATHTRLPSSASPTCAETSTV